MSEHYLRILLTKESNSALGPEPPGVNRVAEEVMTSCEGKGVTIYTRMVKRPPHTGGLGPDYYEIILLITAVKIVLPHLVDALKAYVAKYADSEIIVERGGQKVVIHGYGTRDTRKLLKEIENLFPPNEDTSGEINEETKSVASSGGEAE